MHIYKYLSMKILLGSNSKSALVAYVSILKGVSVYFKMFISL